MTDDPVTLRFKAQFNRGVLIPEPDFKLLGLPDGAGVVVTVDADLIRDDWARRKLLSRDFVPLLGKGTTVIATVGDSGEISSDDRDYGKLVARTAPGVPDYRHWKGLIPVEVILLEDLALSVRVRGSRRLTSCRCSIPYLEVEARSLNHALSTIIRHFEPGRISAVGNVFNSVYVRLDKYRWCSLDEMRLPMER